MQITFDPSNPQDTLFLGAFHHALLSLSVPAKAAQSEVASNTDTTATGSSSFPEGSGVTGAVVGAVQGTNPDLKVAGPAPAVVKTRKEGLQEWRAKKAEKAAAEKAAEVAINPPVIEPSPTPAATDALVKDLNLDDVRSALQTYTASEGMPAGIAVLKRFNAVRVSELPADQYAAFIAACAV